MLKGLFKTKNSQNLSKLPLELQPVQPEILCAEHKQSLGRLKTSWSDTETWESRILPMVHRLAYTVGRLPYSARGLFSQPGGLFEASLQCAAFALDIMESSVQLERNIMAQHLLQNRLRATVCAVSLCSFLEILADRIRIGEVADNEIALREKLAKLELAKFDEVLDEKTHKTWLSPGEIQKDKRQFLKTYDAMPPGLRRLLDKARAHPVWPQVFPVATNFIEEIIPKPIETRGLFWNANAYTTQVEEHFIPLIKLYAGSQNVLGLGFFQFAPFEAWGWVNVEQGTVENMDELTKILPFAKIEVKEKMIAISTSARLLPFVVQKVKMPLRTSVLSLMKTSLLRNGNPALEALLTEK